MNVYILHKCDNLLLLLLSLLKGQLFITIYYPLLKGHVQYVHRIRMVTNIHIYVITYMIHHHWPNMNVWTVVN